MAGREFFTPEEVAALEKRAQEQSGDEGRTKGTRGDVERAYNDFWWDRGTKVTTPRTSLVIDPADGRVPEQTEEAKKRAADEGEAAGVSRHRGQRARDRQLARSQHVRALHHARHAWRDESDGVQQQLSDHAESRATSRSRSRCSVERA